ncbi:hypothetical protein [Cytophaga hutchinsonii]|uniref:Beta-ketoacyl synthase N-terminal domain-containing protein n=1 Tax=Cytophaga hutchinsonii (strain ATCC 33406 / DSM 1761 / CIP 103989 / NBRC 15051 / NCIMB 9469 / D465) TaxID=269798 RepID=A0A6N4SSJ7_CYTH3|nr:hypothetical protein [Cytophaga hutchinsonii]ABG59380.1 hypothetical protein CHU_2117 [Cytophaga hutchinsonii ATCC 33406]SFX92664.1 hypothetical protein SAMN04487930_11371 [Cytophaga hutchinsonii ATCC 33406]
MAYIISGFCRIKVEPSQPDFVSIETAEGKELVKNDPAALYSHLGLEYPKYFKMDTLSKYGILAAEKIIKKRDIKAAYLDTDIGIVISNASGSLDTDIEFQKTITNKENFFPSPAIFVYTLSNIVMGEICIKYKIKGENMFFLSESIQAELLKSYTVQLFNKKTIKAALVGWIDYSQGKPDVLLVLVEQGLGNNSSEIEFTARQIELLYR